MDLSFLPHINASLNAMSTMLLLAGLVVIRQKRVCAHKTCMITAFGVSSLFLALYVIHKAWRVTAVAGLHVTFNHTGTLRVLYLVILVTHLVLAMVVPVLAIWLIRLGLAEQFDRHRRLARVGYPIWLYVSITGVLIYLMLYHWNLPPPSQ